MQLPPEKPKFNDCPDALEEFRMFPALFPASAERENSTTESTEDPEGERVGRKRTRRHPIARGISRTPVLLLLSLGPLSSLWSINRRQSAFIHPGSIRKIPVFRPAHLTERPFFWRARPLHRHPPRPRQCERNVNNPALFHPASAPSKKNPPLRAVFAGQTITI